MESIITTVTENPWIFSGIGVFALSLLLYFVFGIGKPKKSDISQTVNVFNGDADEKDESRTELSIEELKKKVRILFIDDDTKFKNVKILKNQGWINTKTVKDIKSYDDQVVIDADIIFVDVQGVGLILNADGEGLGLSKNIKTKYPNKKVIIYSAITTGDRFHEALRIADDHLHKGADFFEYQNLVEKFSKEIYANK